MVAIPKEILEMNPGLTDWNICIAYRGSHSHGTFIPSSDPDSIDDIDFMGICVPPKEYYLGLKEYGTRGTHEIKIGQYDIVLYELKKLVSLLAKGNPNVLSLLWLRDNDYINRTRAFDLLKAHRDLFVGKHVYHSFNGYAYGQIVKMQKFSTEGYMGEKRKELVERFGYDTKNLSHCIRLMRMCIEFLGDGELRVFREDAKELIAIKKGAWSLEKGKEEADRLFKLAQEAYVNSKLPDKINLDLINKLCIKVIETEWMYQEVLLPKKSDDGLIWK